MAVRNLSASAPPSARRLTERISPDRDPGRPPRGAQCLARSGVSCSHRLRAVRTLVHWSCGKSMFSKNRRGVRCRLKPRQLTIIGRLAVQRLRKQAAPDARSTFEAAASKSFHVRVRPADSTAPFVLRIQEFELLGCFRSSIWGNDRCLRARFYGARSSPSF